MEILREIPATMHVAHMQVRIYNEGLACVLPVVWRGMSRPTAVGDADGTAGIAAAGMVDGGADGVADRADVAVVGSNSLVSHKSRRI